MLNIFSTFSEKSRTGKLHENSLEINQFSKYPHADIIYKHKQYQNLLNILIRCTKMLWSHITTVPVLLQLKLKNFLWFIWNYLYNYALPSSMLIYLYFLSHFWWCLNGSHIHILVSLEKTKRKNLKQNNLIFVFFSRK